jgi:hypothetical protein
VISNIKKIQPRARCFGFLNNSCLSTCSDCAQGKPLPSGRGVAYLKVSRFSTWGNFHRLKISASRPRFYFPECFTLLFSMWLRTLKKCCLVALIFVNCKLHGSILEVIAQIPRGCDFGHLKFSRFSTWGDCAHSKIQPWNRDVGYLKVSHYCTWGHCAHSKTQSRDRGFGYLIT